jgi:capsular polysaccharide biosynthesis protein
LNVPPSEWDEGPGLIESILSYKWVVTAAVLLGAIAAFLWASFQPVRYEGAARLFLRGAAPLGQERPNALDPGRNVRNQAQLLSSPEILESAAKLSGNRISAEELRERLTVDAERDADVITVRILDETPRGAAELADAVITAYGRVADRQAQEVAAQTIRQLERAQRRLEAAGAGLDDALRDNPGNPLLRADRAALNEKLEELAAQKFSVSAEANLGSSQGFQEPAVIPQEPVQPQRVRVTAVGAFLGLVVGAVLSWLLAWRRLTAVGDGQYSIDDGSQEQATGPARLVPPAAHEEQKALPAGLPSASSKPGLRFSRLLPHRFASTEGNGSHAGIVEFDKLNDSIHALFRSLDGDRMKLYTPDVPQLIAEDLARRFQVNVVAVLLEMENGVQMAAHIGFDADQPLRDGHDPELVRKIAKTGPRLITGKEAADLTGNDRLASLSSSHALVPLVSGRRGFGILLIGRRQDTEDNAPTITTQDLEEIDTWVREVTSYIRSWWLLRHLKSRLGVLD